MKYPNIKKAKLSHSQIAKAMGYSNVNSFRCSSAHKRIMEGLDELIGFMDCANFGFHTLPNGRLTKSNGKLDIEIRI